ncbi:MAG: FG-GAP repeat protein [Acidobacteria bacterium]|nr:FG-GAP repeat protein [Acidobacteriota bacterium]
MKLRSIARVVLALAAAGAAARADGLSAATNPQAGRAFVFSGATGQLVLTLNAPDVTSGGRFGETVAGIGDVDGDAVPDIAVGASGVSEGKLKRCGRVYIFSGATGSLLRTISAPAPAAGIRFGFVVAAAGDVNGDGAGDLVVGAPRGKTPGKGKTGAAYLFSGIDGALLATLSPPQPHAGSQFGSSLAAGRDVTGDGAPDILVGAPADPVGRISHSGSIFVFDKQGILESSISNPSPQAGARFGESVSATGDIDGDAVADLAVGADGESLAINDFTGVVFLFSDAGGTPTFLAEDPSATRKELANFGFAVAGLPDVNADGIGDFAATAPDEDISTLASVGRLYVTGGDPNAVSIATFDDPAPAPSDFLGGSLAALPDITGDALPELAVGAELHVDPNGVRIGRAYVVEAKNGALRLTIESPTSDVCSRFGWAVAATADVNADNVADVIVGAPFQRVTSRYASQTCF